VRFVDDKILTSPRSFPLTRVRLTLSNKLQRLLWGIVWGTLFRFSPKVCHGWRCFLLRSFGAKVGEGAHPCPRAKIWAPWNLTMGARSCLADDVDCYCVAPITLGAHATVSQYSYLCAASHEFRGYDFREPEMPLVVAPIVIGAYAWVAADVFVGPGVEIGEGSVVGARSTVLHDVEAWSVVAGSPVRTIGTRPRLVSPR
jgi:putative colanic acid biosynthesis acetyltransferase WcaF